MTRPYHRWTEEEHEVLRASVGLPLRTIRRRLGRPVTISALNKRFPLIVSRTLTEVVEAQGMAVPDIQRALHVSRDTVRRWQLLEGEDRLPSHESYAGTRKRVLTKPMDLIAWIKRGTLAKWGYKLGGRWKPAPNWLGFVSDAERTWCAAHINTRELCALFQFVQHMPSGFPPADVRTSGHQSHWWRRAAIKEWLATNPHYQTAKVKAEL